MNNTFKLSATDATIKNKLIHIIIVIVLDENFEQQKLYEHSVDKRQETATMTRAESQTVGLKSRSAVFFRNMRASLCNPTEVPLRFFLLLYLFSHTIVTY